VDQRASDDSNSAIHRKDAKDAKKENYDELQQPQRVSMQDMTPEIKQTCLAGDARPVLPNSSLARFASLRLNQRPVIAPYNGKHDDNL
jgi:hypothetical protein